MTQNEIINAVLLVAAIICFVLAAFDQPRPRSFDWQPLGFALVAASLLV